ncbi:uncharacterized protein LOC109819583 isoform X2 [Asparagus officinalis]|uniref:uncharacterized protein LOC109819583 isoform X2 n=1 Tax=Asparagus officinalis TaxID=4686 RepID=UPI00098E32D6|nr:uncharacterized protein LOC109819583 isoform X2 [Asparagus officinalis]
MVEDHGAEIVKENASLVDSSLTECKHDLQNCDGPESSINKNNGDCNCDKEEQVYPSCDVVRSSHMTNNKLYTRYFVIKSLSHQNIQLSVEKGIWATQIMNEPILEEAFHNSDRVILIFSVNMSGFFQGYAQMMSSVSWKRDNVWSKSSGGSNPWGRSFKVKWLQLSDLPFQKTLHLKNPLNDYKPVKISRDCQELSADIGEALCELFDGEVDTKGRLKRANSFMDDGLPKRSCRSSPINFESQDSMLSEPSLHMRWAGPTMLHPSLLYQHVQHEENTHHTMLGRSQRLSFHQNSYFYMDPENSLCKKQPSLNKHMNKGPGQRNEFLESIRKDTPLEENLDVSLTEEDFLSMINKVCEGLDFGSTRHSAVGSGIPYLCNTVS